MDIMLRVVILIGYGMRWMKYGANSFVKKDGMTSNRRTMALGSVGPTRSSAADSMITYSTDQTVSERSQAQRYARPLFMRPTFLSACPMKCVDY